VLSRLVLPSLAEPSYIALDGYLRFGLKPFFEEYVPFFFVFNELLCDKYELWFLVYRFAVQFQFPIGIQSTILTVI